MTFEAGVAGEWPLAFTEERPWHLKDDWWKQAYHPKIHFIVEENI